MSSFDEKFIVLITALQRPIKKLAGRLTCHLPGLKEEVADLVLETWLKAWKRRDTFHGCNRRDAAKWLGAILRNVVRLKVRDRNRKGRDAHGTVPLDSVSTNEEAGVSSAGGAEPPELVLLVENVHLFDARFPALDDDAQFILSLRIGLDRSFAEIGEILFISTESARQRYHRARERLVGVAWSRGLLSD